MIFRLGRHLPMNRIRIIKHEARHIAKLARRMKRTIKPCKLGEVQASAAPVATVRLPGHVRSDAT